MEGGAESSSFSRITLFEVAFSRQCFDVVLNGADGVITQVIRDLAKGGCGASLGSDLLNRVENLALFGGESVLRHDIFGDYLESLGVKASV